MATSYSVFVEWDNQKRLSDLESLHLFNIPFHSLGENFEATASGIIYSDACRAVGV